MMKKIAFITEDGERLSSHFGTAPYYHIFAIEDGKVTGKEIREKPGQTHHGHHDHDQDHGHHNHDHDHHHEHGGKGRQGHGKRKLELISDCQILVAGGMGVRAYQHAIDQGLEVIMSGGRIEDALALYLKGELNSDMRRIHKH